MGDRARPGQLERETARQSDWDLAQRIEALAKAGKITRLKAETAMQVVRALRAQIALQESGDYTVESWSRGSLKRSFGTLNQHDAAIGAFEGVVIAFPNEHITVRERARILRRHNDPKA